MVKIYRPEGSPIQGSARLPINGLSTGQEAIGSAVSQAGRASQNTNIGAISRSLGAAISSEGKVQMEQAAASIRTSVLNDTLARANLSYNEALQQRVSQTTDKNGNPLYTSLVDDTAKIGNQILQNSVKGITDLKTRQLFEQSFNSTIQNRQLDSLKIARRQQLDHSQAAFEKYSIAKINEAKSGEFGAINIPLGELREAVNSRIASGELTKSDGDALFRSLDREVRVFKYQEMIGTNPKQAYEMLKEGDEALSPEDALTLKIKAKNGIAAAAKAQQAYEKALEQKVEFGFKQAEDFLNKGLPIPDDLIGFLNSATQQTGLNERVKGLIERQEPILKFSKMNTVERSKALAQMERAAQLDPELAKNAETFQRLNKYIETQLEKDPVSFIISQDLVADRPSLDVTKDIGQQLAARGDITAALESEYGVTSSGLTAAETEALAHHVDQLSPSEQIEVMQSIGSSLGDDSASKLYADMSKHADGLIAYSGMLASAGNTAVAINILEGRKILADKSIAKPSPKFIQEKLVDIDMPVYMHAQQSADVNSAIQAIYARKALQAGVLEADEIDDKILEQAIAEATNGGAIEYNDSYIEPPVYGMSEGDFEDWVEGITVDELSAIGATEETKSILEDSDLITVGRGRYIIKSPRVTDPFPLLADDGKVLILDYNDIENMRSDALKSEPNDVVSDIKATDDVLSRGGSMGNAFSSGDNTKLGMHLTDQVVKMSSASANPEVMRSIANSDILAEYGITDENRINHFLAQMSHESGGFKHMTELRSDESAERKYGAGTSIGRRLGNTQPGDGAKFKGRGIIQLTGRDNYRRYGNMIGVDLESNPELAAQPEIAVRIAAAYWQSKGLNALADAGNIREITRRINGGYNGLADRKRRFQSLNA